MKHYRILVLAAVPALQALTATALAQGSLTPPPGPPAPVMKTLAEVEPRIAINATHTPGDNDATASSFKITQPGSYYLTGSIVGEAGKVGIEIASADVTIDLNGFELRGTGVGSGNGIFVSSGAFTRLAVRNGTIRSWGGDGIRATASSSIRLENLMLHANSGRGADIGSAGLISDCIAESNGGSGFMVRGDCVVMRCVSRANFTGFVHDGTGIRFGDCIASRNTSHGFVATYGRGVATGCAADSNDGAGFQGYFAVHDSVASFNASDGIAQAMHVENCESFGNGGRGIVTTQPARIIGNKVHGNGSSVSNGAGIRVGGNHSVVMHNTCAENDLGIDVNGSSCVVEGNSCSGNTAEGILVQASHNTIDGNRLTQNQTGLRVTGEYNLIIRNAARNSSGVNWNIAQFNRAGAYVAPANNAAINGNTGGNGTGTTDPYANVSF